MSRSRALALGFLVIFGWFARARAAELDDADLNRRIEELRKVDATIVLPAGVTGKVAFALVDHAFRFGTAVSSSMMPGPWSEGKSKPADQEKYAGIARTHFNAAVPENGCKWPAMEQADGTQVTERALGMYAWCVENGLHMRGHNVFWGVPRWQPDWLKDLAPAETEARMKRRMRHVVDTFKGKVEEWDLINELTDQDLFQTKLGWKDPSGYFTWAQEMAPEFTWYVNEFGPLQSGKVEKVEKLCRLLREKGARFDGIGDQAHFFRPLPPNAELWQILDRLAAFGVPVLITEYDHHHQGMTEEQQGEYLRRFLKLCFAHPAVAGFYVWGFWDGRHWRKDCGLWRKDWTIKPNGQAWRDLVLGEWTTAGTAGVADGRITFRGFMGTYQLTWNGGGATVEVDSDEPVTATRQE